MASVKPVVPEDAILAILAGQLSGPFSELHPLGGGQISSTYVVTAAGRGYIIQFNHDNMDANFEKSEYVARNFASPAVPIPEVIRVGRLDDLHYCITREAPGRHMADLPAEEQVAALPSLMDTLDAIHETALGARTGWGLFDGHGQGLYESWPGYLATVRDEERADGFYGKWHHLFETTFLERAIFDRVYERFADLVRSAPPQRYLVHGNFGFRNLLVADGRVTAVLDWLDARYGDFLYDVAGLDFWDTDRGYRERFRARYAGRGDVPADYERRVLCYQCYLALDGFRFFAKMGDEGAYRWTRDRIRSLCGM